LLVLAYLVGGAIRFNIRHFERIENEGWGPPQTMAFISRVVLACAYFISISYYLQLLAAFVLDGLGVQNAVAPSLVSSALLVLIAGVGMWRGLAELGTVEKYAVSLNLGAIAALLVALAVYNGRLALGGEWALPPVSSEVDIKDLRILLGLLIVVQGFESSRYLGSEYNVDERIATMRSAQLVSTVIYLVFIALVTVLFRPGMGGDVTAIIGMTRPVALVLPVLLAVAAVGSQFSAAVADSEGAGGLIEELSHSKLPSRYTYGLILVVTVTLTWGTNVNQIIAYASRAFAFYYCLQCIVAFLVARRHKGPKLGQSILFAVLAVVCLVVSLLGLPSE
jgi:hypothetical protein